MLADLPATRHQVAQLLGISTVTLNKYIKADQAPRPIMLALFWETRWGVRRQTLKRPTGARCITGKRWDWNGKMPRSSVNCWCLKGN